MADETDREPARDTQDLERLLIERQWAGDVDGMVALLDPHAVVDTADGRVSRGKEEIRALFADVVASGRKYELGKQSPALVNGDLALTSTRLADGTATAEVARRQSDGTWLWVIDRFCVT
jgi:ketosteroid isomerase-like protein